MADFVIPELGENITGGDVVRILVKPGDTLKNDQPVLELETDKATIEVPSTVAGVVKELKIKSGEKPRVPYVTQMLHDAPGVLIAASDYVKALPDSIDRWLPRPLTALGTDGFGRSESRAALREFFEVDYRYVIVATLAALARDKKIDASVVAEAMKAHDVNPEKVNPAVS